MQHKNDKKLSIDETTKLHMNIIGKTMCSLPLPLLSVVSSYLTIDETNIYSDTSSKLESERWKDGINLYFDSLLCNKSFLLKIIAKSDHSADCVGSTTTYDISISDSVSRFVQYKILDRAIKKQSLSFDQDHMQCNRFDTAIIYILTQYYNSTTDTGGLTFTSHEDPMNNAESITVIDKDRYFNSIYDRSYIFLAGCINILSTLKDIMNKNNDVMVHSTNKTEQLEAKNKSEQVIFQENSKKIQYLYEILDIENEQFNNTIRSMNDPNQSSSNSDQQHYSKESIIIDYFKQKKISKVYANVNTKQYEIQMDQEFVSKNVGIWGKNDLYLNYLGQIRQLRKYTGYNDYINKVELENQEDYGGYLSNNTNLSSSSSFTTPKKSTTTTTTTTNTTFTNQQSTTLPSTPIKSSSNNSHKNSTIEDMIDERITYCKSIQDAVSEIFFTVTTYINNSLKHYTDTVDTSNLLNRSHRSIFREKVYNNDSFNSNNTLKSFNSLKIDSNHHQQQTMYPNLYVGTSDYESEKKELHIFKLIFNYIMDKTERIFYIDNECSENDENFMVTDSDDIHKDQQQNGKFSSYPQERYNVIKFNNDLIDIFDTSPEEYHRRMKCENIEWESIIKDEKQRQMMNFFKYGYIDKIIGNTNIIKSMYEDVNFIKKLNYAITSGNGSNVGVNNNNDNNDIQIVSTFKDFQDLLHTEIRIIDGIPECLLYDEISIIKLVMLSWRSKTDINTLARNNNENDSLPSLYTLISKIWSAKSFLMICEYEYVSEEYDKSCIEPMLDMYTS